MTNSQNVTTISHALTWASARLGGSSTSAHLDAEILLTHVLKVSRTYLITSPATTLTSSQQNDFLNLIARRAQGEPLAYLIGNREFWSLDITVTPDTLIPRPESELLVELVLNKFSDATPRIIADLGTGSGALALALASERPDWVVHATDRVAATLAVANENAARLQLSNIIFHEGFWCDALPGIKFDAIVSNPPYIAEGDPELAQDVAQFQPRAALIAGADGLADLRLIINNAGAFIRQDGYLLLEHGARQSAEVANLMASAGFQEILAYTDLAGLSRVTEGRAK